MVRAGRSVVGSVTVADGAATSKRARASALLHQLSLELGEEAIAFSDLVARFRAGYVAKRRMTDTRRRHLLLSCDRLAALFGSRSVEQIGPDCELVVYREFSLPTVRTALLKTLKQIMAWGRRKMLVTAPDELDMIRPSRGRRYEGRTTPEQTRKILAALEHMPARYKGNRAIADMLILYLRTGRRPGELARLEWDQVSLRTATMRITYSKGGEPIESLVRLGPRATDVLRRQPTRAGLVFPSPRTGGPIREGCWLDMWRRALAAAGLPHKPSMDGYLRPYAGRHGYASTAIERGHSTKEIAAQIGTSVRILEETYLHTNEKLHRKLALDMD